MSCTDTMKSFISNDFINMNNVWFYLIFKTILQPNY